MSSVGFVVLAAVLLFGYKGLNVEGQITTCQTGSNDTLCLQSLCGQSCMCTNQTRCHQSCAGNRCASLNCTSSNECIQDITGSFVSKAHVHGSITYQDCSGSQCSQLVCHADKNCKMKCEGSKCPEMVCLGKGKCEMICISSTCVMDCGSQASRCDLHCSGGSFCNMTCTGPNCATNCSLGSTCHIDKVADSGVGTVRMFTFSQLLIAFATLFVFVLYM